MAVHNSTGFSECDAEEIMHVWAEEVSAEVIGANKFVLSTVVVASALCPQNLCWFEIPEPPAAYCSNIVVIPLTS